MKKLLIATLFSLVAVGLVAGSQFEVRPAGASKCSDWGNDTSDRIAAARELLYPQERQTQTTGSLQGDAQALYQLAQDQANSSPPDTGFNLNGDLIEAMSAGSTALSGGGGGGGSAEAQIALAKGIIYNADLRIAYLLDGC